VPHPGRLGKEAGQIVAEGSHARWKLKYTKAKPRADGKPRIDLAVPVFGYKNHLGIDRRHRLIHSWAVTDAAHHDGALLPELINKDNTAGDVWADTAYRSTASEKYLANHALRSQIHCKKPTGKPMPRHTARANGRKSKVRAAVEYVFAQQKGPMGLFIRTIGLARATTKIGLANLVYNMKRMVWLAAQTVPV
jgi:IS5 family transposase